MFIRTKYVFVLFFIQNPYRVFKDYVQIWSSGEIEWHTTIGQLSADIVRQTDCSSHWQHVCVPHRYWKYNIGTGLALVCHPFLHASGVLLFLKTLYNLDRHTPLANHGFNCAGWYVTVNITCNSHNSWPSPYRAVLRHSLTLLHFIIPRLAGVLCSDSESCCQGSDYDGSTDEITGKSNSGEMVKCSGEVQLFYPPINLESRIF